VTVYYRWHPLYGRTLKVHKRKRDSSGEQLYCTIDDNTICALPVWMFNPECTHLSLGPPVIELAALIELQELLTFLQDSSSSTEASLTLIQEVNDEAIAGAPRDDSVSPATNETTVGGTAARKTKRAGSGAGRTITASRQRPSANTKQRR
jgi:hypothetical protein